MPQTNKIKTLFSVFILLVLFPPITHKTILFVGNTNEKTSLLNAHLKRERPVFSNFFGDFKGSTLSVTFKKYLKRAFKAREASLFKLFLRVFDNTLVY